MPRNHNTNLLGESFGDDTVQAVWNKGKVIAGQDPNKFRMDRYDAIIQRDKYGDTSNEYGYGWEIDHIVPACNGGKDFLSNLQPLQWQNNRRKGTNRDPEVPVTYK